MQRYSNKTLHFNKILGKIVRNLRTDKTNISLNQFAREYDIDRGNLSKFENGVMSCRVVTLWKISEALGIKLSDLIKNLENELGENFSLIDE